MRPTALPYPGCMFLPLRASVRKTAADVTGASQMTGLGTAKMPRKCAPDPHAFSLWALAGPDVTP
jgi:hypothetical protein